MSVGFQAVQWNRFKIVYDVVMWTGVAALIITFITVTAMTQPDGESYHPVQLVLRAFGLTAIVLLFIITLSIGPLARLSDRFKPLLYNRRHMGVTVFFLGFIHAGLVLLWYHGFSETNVFVSLLSTNSNYDRIYGFPFEALGLGALLILFVMAATSHDFWLDVLSAPVLEVDPYAGLSGLCAAGRPPGAGRAAGGDLDLQCGAGVRRCDDLDHSASPRWLEGGAR